MFAATVVNFILFSMNTGGGVALFIVLIRKALILDTDYPLLEKSDSISSALRNVLTVNLWTGYLPVSIKLSLSDLVSIHAKFTFGGGIFQRSHCHVEGLGHLSRSTVANPHAVHFMDWVSG